MKKISKTLIGSMVLLGSMAEAQANKDPSDMSAQGTSKESADKRNFKERIQGAAHKAAKVLRISGDNKTGALFNNAALIKDYPTVNDDYSKLWNDSKLTSSTPVNEEQNAFLFGKDLDLDNATKEPGTSPLHSQTTPIYNSISSFENQDDDYSNVLKSIDNPPEVNAEPLAGQKLTTHADVHPNGLSRSVSMPNIQQANDNTSDEIHSTSFGKRNSFDDTFFSAPFSASSMDAKPGMDTDFGASLNQEDAVNRDDVYDLRALFKEENDEVYDLRALFKEENDEVYDLSSLFKEESDEVYDLSSLFKEESDEVYDLSSLFKEESDEVYDLSSLFEEISEDDVDGDDGKAPGLSSVAAVDVSLVAWPPRPEAGIYAANMASANTLFATRSRDRIGAAHYHSDVNSGDDPIQPSLWMHVAGGQNKARLQNGAISTRTNSQKVMLGGEVFNQSLNNVDGLHMGVLFGAGKTSSHSQVTKGNSAKGGVSGQTVGIYSTWYSNDDNQEGPYLDGQLNYGWFDNRLDVKATGAEAAFKDEYRSRGFVGSLEAGYTWKLFNHGTHNTYLQPQMQVTWMGVQAKDHLNKQGSTVSMLGADNVQIRLGSRLYMSGCAGADMGKQRVFQPYLELNAIHNTKDFGVKLDNAQYRLQGAKHIGEAKIGIDGQINQSLSIWGGIGQQVGASGYHDTQGTLGVKVNF